MATRRVAGRRNFRGAQRRKFVWARSDPGGLAAVGTVLSANLLAGFETALGGQLIGATVARIRGVIICEPPATAADHRLVVAVKIGSGAATAVDAGPIVAPYEDWLMYEPFMTGPTPTGYTAYGMGTFNRTVDVKSMRKFEELGQELTIVADGDVGTWELSWHLSIGLLLP
jgi:hypothetical protein